MVFFTVVIRMLIISGALPALAEGLSALLSPLGLTEQWGERLLTGVLEISSGVWTLSGEGSLTGRLSMAAFMLGWAGISVHSQVLSFLGGSGLSVRTYLVGKMAPRRPVRPVRRGPGPAVPAGGRGIGLPGRAGRGHRLAGFLHRPDGLHGGGLGGLAGLFRRGCPFGEKN